MEATFKHLSDGTITSPGGFSAGATHAGIRDARDDRADLGILCSDVPCVAAGVFTSNRIKASPVLVCQRHLADSSAQALMVNSGCANACIGEQGLADALEMATLAAQKLGLATEQVLVASTGVIGVPLPMDRLRAGIEGIALSSQGGHELAKAIMTTDTFPKEIAVTARIGGAEVTLGGIAKGAGMIHPNLATMLCFLTTDADIEADFLQTALRQAADVSFNMITIDGDTSPNDTVLLLANGLAANRRIKAATGEAKAFQAALQEVCVYLARRIARDGEGATRFIEVAVEGALTTEDARSAARTIAGSSLVKAAVHGSDPNWGRIVAALGRSGAQAAESRLDLYLDDLCLVKAGCPLRFDPTEARALLGKDEVTIRVCLNLGKESAVAWGCDLSEEYVTINSAYTT